MGCLSGPGRADMKIVTGRAGPGRDFEKFDEPGQAAAHPLEI